MFRASPLLKLVILMMPFLPKVYGAGFEEVVKEGRLTREKPATVLPVAVVIDWKAKHCMALIRFNAASKEWEEGTIGVVSEPPPAPSAHCTVVVSPSEIIRAFFDSKKIGYSFSFFPAWEEGQVKIHRFSQPIEREGDRKASLAEIYHITKATDASQIITLDGDLSEFRREALNAAPGLTEMMPTDRKVSRLIMMLTKRSEIEDAKEHGETAEPLAGGAAGGAGACGDN